MNGIIHDLDEQMLDDAFGAALGSEWRYTQEGLAFLPPGDPLGRSARMPVTGRYSVLGVPLEMETNAPVFLALMDDLFREWNEPWPHGGRVLRLRVLLDEPAGHIPQDTGKPAARMQEDYLMLSCAASLGFADRTAGFASAFLTPELAANGPRAQTYFLECLALFLACRERPVTLHAAAVVWRDRCVLLTGVSGAGKSTLAYACHRAGYQVLAEDVVFAPEPRPEIAPVLAIHGHAPYLHLLPGSTRFFPELVTLTGIRQFNGETKLRVKLENDRAAKTHHAVWGVCSLSRTSGPGAALLPADGAYLRRSLTKFEGEPPVDAAAVKRAADMLAQGRTAHLVSGNDPGEAAETLKRWMEET
jgi:hypothetical protein